MRFIPLAFVGAILFFSSCKQDEPATDSDIVEEPVLLEVEEIKRYGLNPSEFEIHENTINRNEFLSDILLEYGVSYQAIAELETASKDVHDVRRLKAGDDYAVFLERDSAKTARYFIVETTPADYVVYVLSDSIHAYTGQKPIDIKIREASGEINSSLYQTIADNDLSPELALKLNEIYAWTVDFYRIQKGDYFKVVFEEMFVEGERVGIGRILASEFSHRQEAFFAYRYEGTEIPDYYDETGESLRKAFLRAPLKFSRISSRYSRRRYHPVQKRWKAHLGTDYAAPTGTPIMATGDGTVIASAYGKYNGNYVKIRHNSTYTTQYLHMSRRAVKKGEFVRQGETIGYVGSTGLATGPHVCYRFWRNGKQVDPYQQDLPPSEPLDEKYMTDFSQVVDSLSTRLKAIDLQIQDQLSLSK